MPNRAPLPDPTPPPPPVHAPPQLTLARTLRLTGRALRLRCPHCGRGKLFDRWLQMRRRCDRCGLVLERGEEDYFIGAYMLNLIIAELIVVAIMLLVLLATRPPSPGRRCSGPSSS